MSVNRSGFNFLVVAVLVFPIFIFPTVAVSQDFSLWLTRHAEKQTRISNAKQGPELTPAGHLRAEALAACLQNQPLQKIYSTDYLRTKQTVEPTARALGQKIVIYRPDQQADFARKLLNRQENALIAGHSNTIPELVKLLGGVPGKPIRENEYGQIYRLSFHSGQSKQPVVTTEMVECNPAAPKQR